MARKYFSRKDAKTQSTAVFLKGHLCAFASLREKYFRCLLVVAFLVCPASAAAIPLADYQQKLKQSITALDTLAQINEDESASEYLARVHQTCDGVRAVLPQQVTIEAGGDTYNVDNSALHKSLDELEKANAQDQLIQLKQITQTLQALETRISERQSAAVSDQNKEQAKSRLETILARPEYAHDTRGPNALTRLIQDILRWILKLFPQRRTMDANRVDWISLIAQILVIGLAVAGLTYVAITLLRRFGRSRKPKTRKKREARIVLGERLEPEATATDLLSQAEMLARQGDLRAAIRKAYIALLVELGDRKMISLAQHKTNRDYLNSVRSMPPLHSTMRGLTDSFERHWYGFEQATPDDWQDFRAGYLAALQVQS